MDSNNQIAVYYSHLISALGRSPETDIVAVAHMVPNTLSFGPALDDLGKLVGFLGKPKSIKRPEFRILAQKFRSLPLSRARAGDGTAVVKTLRRECRIGGRPLVLVDIGGYFASAANQIKRELGESFLGIVEGTENGVQKYELHEKSVEQPFDVPIATVARSPLKLPEDYLVASSVVFSIESTLRQQVEILQTRSACVIGYGRVGSAIADILRGRGISTAIYDIDPIKLAEGAARGFKAHKRRQDALAQVSLVVCATGNRALDLTGFASLAPGCVVASTTSADDEFDLMSLEAGYKREELSDRMVRYTENRLGREGRSFYLVADGNAANFLDGAVIGPAMQLIEGEKLAAIRALIDRRLKNGIVELDREDRLRVAEIWNHHFL